MRIPITLIFLISIFSCSPKLPDTPELNRIRPIDSLVRKYDFSLSETALQKVDTLGIQTGSSSLECRVGLGPSFDKLRFSVRDTNYRVTDFYYDSSRLVLTMFYDVQGGVLNETGRRYFESDTLFYTLLFDRLPDIQQTLNLADSVRQACQEKR